MKFIISENRIDDLVVKHLDNVFDVANIGWIYGADEMGNDVDYAAEFYEGDFEYGENTIFRWYNKDYWFDENINWGYDPDRLKKVIEDSPIVEFEDSYLSSQLDSIFGDRWEKPFKIWFEDNFHFPVKTILK
jgi:hypothetical protein